MPVYLFPASGTVSHAWTGDRVLARDTIVLRNVPLSPSTASPFLLTPTAFAEATTPPDDNWTPPRALVVLHWLGFSPSGGGIDVGVRFRATPPARSKFRIGTAARHVEITFGSGSTTALTLTATSSKRAPTQAEAEALRDAAPPVQGIHDRILTAYWDGYSDGDDWSDGDDLSPYLEFGTLDLLHGQPAANQRQGRLQPSQLKISGYNDDGRFAPENAQSPYNAGTKAIGEVYVRLGLSDIVPLPPATGSGTDDDRLLCAFSGRLERPAVYSRWTANGLRRFADLTAYGLLVRALGMERQIAAGTVQAGSYAKALMVAAGLQAPEEAVVGASGWTTSYAVGHPSGHEQFVPALANAQDVEVSELTDQDPGAVNRYHRLLLLPRNVFAKATPVEATFIDREPGPSDTVEGWHVRVRNPENIVSERLQHSDFNASAIVGETYRYHTTEPQTWTLAFQGGTFVASGTGAQWSVATPPNTYGGWRNNTNPNTHYQYQESWTRSFATVHPGVNDVYHSTQFTHRGSQSFAAMKKIAGALDGISKVDWTGASNVAAVCSQNGYLYINNPSGNSGYDQPSTVNRFRIWHSSTLLGAGGRYKWPNTYQLDACEVRASTSDWQNPMLKQEVESRQPNLYSFWSGAVTWCGLYVNPSIPDFQNLSQSTDQEANVVRNLGRRPFPYAPVFSTSADATAWLAAAKRKFGAHHKRVMFHFRPGSGRDAMRLAGLRRGHKIRVDLGAATGEDYTGHMFVQSVNIVQRRDNVLEFNIDALAATAYYDPSA